MAKKIIGNTAATPITPGAKGYVTQEEFSKLNGAYVFYGSYFEFSELPHYSIPKNITPVFNYLGKETTFTQPWSGTPYLITIKDMGWTLCECQDGVHRASFSIPQNEGIIFKPGLSLMLTMYNGEILNETVHSVSYGANYNNPSEMVANVILERTELFNDAISYVHCEPTVTFRTGDNIAIIEVAGNVFYEVLSHDYGDDIEALKREIVTGGGSVDLDEFLSPYAKKTDLNNYATTETCRNHFDLANTYTDYHVDQAMQYIDEKVGEIETALSEIKSLQNQYIGGDSE